jgi:hypothetical protein
MRGPAIQRHPRRVEQFFTEYLHRLGRSGRRKPLHLDVVETMAGRTIALDLVEAGRLLRLRLSNEQGDCTSFGRRAREFFDRSLKRLLGALW